MDGFLFRKRAEAGGTFIQQGGHDRQAQWRRRFLSSTGHGEALEVALGHVDQVAAQVADLPVAARGGAFPGRFIEQAVELGPLGAVEVQQELFARVVHHVDARRRRFGSHPSDLPRRLCRLSVHPRTCRDV